MKIKATLFGLVAVLIALSCLAVASYIITYLLGLEFDPVRHDFNEVIGRTIVGLVFFGACMGVHTLGCLFSAAYKHYIKESSKL